MKHCLLIFFTLFGCVASLLPIACTREIQGKVSDIQFAGSTPGDPEILTMLGLPTEQQVDFIKWHLTFTGNNTTEGNFSLDLNYGLSKPNTRGFIDGGTKAHSAGTYRITEIQGMKSYTLRSRESGLSLHLIQFTENLMHILSNERKLMVGNGGWSYTINRVNPVSGHAMISIPLSIVPDTNREVTFTGRTPCMPFAKDYGLSMKEDCFKLKWKLVLQRDSLTGEPSSYILSRTGSRPDIINGITGKWKIETPATGTLIYILDPEFPEQSLRFWQADENVLFLLDKKGQFYTGNEEFSFTFDRRQT